MKNRTLFKTALVILASLVVIGASEDDMYIVKPYGDLQPMPHGLRELSRHSANKFDYDAYRSYYTIVYFTRVDPETLKSPMVVVRINVIHDHDAAVAYLVRKMAVEQAAFNKDVKENKGNKIIKFRRGPVNLEEQIYWISGDYMIYIKTDDMIATPQELLDDYLAKYPPTYAFSDEDVDIQKTIKKQLDDVFEEIEDYDDNRGWISRTFIKSREYKALMMQCHYEQIVKCQIGQIDEKGRVECTIAFMLDDSEREREWKKLEKEAEKSEIVLKNVDWQNPEHLKCRSGIDNKQRKAMEALNMDDNDLPPEARLPR